MSFFANENVFIQNLKLHCRSLSSTLKREISQQNDVCKIKNKYHWLKRLSFMKLTVSMCKRGLTSETTPT